MTGSQEPRVRVEPPRSGTDGGDAAELMAAYGVPLFPWQRSVVDCWLGLDEYGAYNVATAGLAVPRQNGKNVCLEAREFFGMVMCGQKFAHTAHQTVTSKKSFRRLAAMFTNSRHPEICDLVKNIRWTNGEEAIELCNGGSVEFSTRSRERGRGFSSIDALILDEAQELTDDQLAAILPTLAASEAQTPQIILAGTPNYPGCPGTVFRRRRSQFLKDPGIHDAWHEWSVDAETPEAINVEDRQLWALVNPSMGYLLTEDRTLTELQSMSRADFCRERLGWWAPELTQKVEYAIPAEVWDACKSTEQKPEGKTAYGVKFSPDGSEVSLCGAVIPAEGPARISLIERKSTAQGTRWLAQWLNERYSRACCVVVDGRNGADVLIDRITETWRMKGSVVRPTSREVVAAAGTLTDALAEKTVSWYFGQEVLRESAVTCTRRPIAGGWGFGGENATPIEAAALALWGAKTSKRDPQRRMRIG